MRVSVRPGFYSYKSRDEACHETYISDGFPTEVCRSEHSYESGDSADFTDQEFFALRFKFHKFLDFGECTKVSTKVDKSKKD